MKFFKKGVALASPKIEKSKIKKGRSPYILVTENIKIKKGRSPDIFVTEKSKIKRGVALTSS